MAKRSPPSVPIKSSKPSKATASKPAPGKSQREISVSRFSAPDKTCVVASSLLPLLVPIDTLNSDEGNARTHGHENIEAVKASLERFGQYVPLVVQKHGMTVRAGNGRLQAMRELGWTHCAALVLDGDDVEMTLLSLTDNKTGDMSDFDIRVLSGKIKELADAGSIELQRFGWSEKELETLRNYSWDVPTLDENDPAFSPSTSDQQSPLDTVVCVTCPKCKHKFAP